MRIIEVRIKNYRTIRLEQSLRMDGGATIVGPNNSGKTNLLRAILAFFTGYKNESGYDREVDLTFGAGTQKSSFVATFGPTGHPSETHIYELLDELHRIVGTEREDDEFTVSLYFTGPENTPVYRVFPNRKVTDESQRPNFSRKQKELVEGILAIFRCHYVPSAKSVSALYDDLLNPFLRSIAAEVLTPQLETVMQALQDVADSVNESFEKAGLDGISAQFSLKGSFQDLISGFDLTLQDPHKTLLDRKGQGIQSAALFASFVWITHQELNQGIQPLWLIEEPESYLHPELASSVQDMMNQLGTLSQVVVTTHSLAFVPSDVERITGTELEQDFTQLVRYKTLREATSRIRDSLGVRFSDYYNLSECNLFVEGALDQRLIEWFIETVAPTAGYEWPALRSAAIQEFGGVRQLEGFLRATYAVIRDERAVVSIFDGDVAGQRSRSSLQQFFGQKGVPFESGKDFVSVRSGYAIEGLFPDQWILDTYAEHPTWFEEFSQDSQGTVEPFRIVDNRKSSFASRMIGIGDETKDLRWASRWLLFCEALEEALQSGIGRLAI